MGTEIKGASRWLSLGAVTIQPSEFLRPGMAVLSAWLFARHRIVEGSRAHLVAVCLMLAVGALLLAQPDLGMTVAIAAVWLGQFVLAGLSLAILFPAMIALVLAGVGAYFLLPHVHARVAVFLGEGDRYQIEKSLNAFRERGAGRPRAGRGRHQGTAAGRPCGLHLRGRRRGVRPDRLPCAGRGLRTDRLPGRAAAHDGGEPVRVPRRRGPAGGIRPAGLRQHGVVARAGALQGG